MNLKYSELIRKVQNLTNLFLSSLELWWQKIISTNNILETTTDNDITYKTM